MTRVSYQINIKKPIEKVYKVSQDYDARYEWDSFPESIALLNGAKQIEKGVRVAVKGKNGLNMEVEYVQVMPPTTAAIRMKKGPFVLKSFAGSWVFKSNSATETNAQFVYSIRAKWWTIPPISELIARLYFSKVIKSRLNGLKVYCEKN